MTTATTSLPALLTITCVTTRKGWFRFRCCSRSGLVCNAGDAVVWRSIARTAPTQPERLYGAPPKRRPGPLSVRITPCLLQGFFIMRIGHGYDVHRFGEGHFITLGGVRIPHRFGLLAHSDGDVVLHALSDALLGAAALGDIGKHFPDTDPAYKGADSRVLLRHVLKQVQ